MGRLAEHEEISLPPDSGSGGGKQSLLGVVSFDVARVVLRRFFVPVAGWMVTTGLVVLCGWLMWRGVKSFVPGEPSAQTAVSASPAVAQGNEVPTALASTGVGAPTVLAFLLAILLLPVVTISFIRTMVSKRSNGVNALTLAIYTAADFILAFFMVGATLETTGKAVVFIGVGVFSLLYNFTVMNYALKLEDGR